MSCPRFSVSWRHGRLRRNKMGTKELLFAVSGLFVLGGCSPSTQEHSLKGIVADATMNTVSVVENGDTLSFGTANADKEGLTAYSSATRWRSVTEGNMLSEWKPCSCPRLPIRKPWCLPAFSKKGCARKPLTEAAVPCISCSVRIP